VSSTERPDAANVVSADVKSAPVIYTYLNIPKVMSRLIPDWLWKKKVPNVATSQRAMPVAAKKNNPLFQSESADLMTMVQDFMERGIVPFHIHLMVREHGNLRVRISWLKQPLERIEEHEMEWVKRIFRRFAWAVKAYPNQGTEHLPPHISVSCGFPQERDETTTVESVQIFQGELSLINDPDSEQSKAQVKHYLAELR
jgi:hypothetical protein